MVREFYRGQNSNRLLYTIKLKHELDMSNPLYYSIGRSIYTVGQNKRRRVKVIRRRSVRPMDQRDESTCHAIPMCLPRDRQPCSLNVDAMTQRSTRNTGHTIYCPMGDRDFFHVSHAYLLILIVHQRPTYQTQRSSGRSSIPHIPFITGSRF